VNCAEFVELVTAFLDGELPEDDEQLVTEHLTECDGCTTYLAQFRTTVDLLGHLPEDDVQALPADKRDALMAAFRKKSL
jgi:anti-sigma factor RsiW